MEPKPTPPPAPPATAPEIQIDDVNSTLKQYILKRHGWQLALLLPFTIAYEVVLGDLFIHLVGSNSGSNGGKGPADLMVLPFILFSSWYWHLKKKFEDTFLREFASRNGFNYQAAGTVDEAYGTIFRVQGSPRVSDIVTGTYHGATLRLFLHDLTVQAGRYSVTYRNTVVELDLAARLPDILLVAKGSSNKGLPLAANFGTSNAVSLEGDFDQHFKLLTPPGNQIAALEVFSPDTMQLVEQLANHYDIEFAGNRIYIYANSYIVSNQALVDVFSLARQLIDKVAPVAGRMQGDNQFVSAQANTPARIDASRSKYSSLYEITAISVAVLMIIILAVIVVAAQSPQ